MLKQLYIILCLCSFLSINAQQTSIYLKFTDIEVPADEFGNVSSAVELSNLTNTLWSGSIKIESSTSNLHISSTSTKFVQINTGQRIFIPIIAHVDQAADSEAHLFIRAKIINELGQTIQVVEQKILIQKNRRILLLNQENHIQFQQIGDTIQLRALIQNKGNTAEKLHYVLTLPNQVNKLRTQSTRFVLAPQQDTLIAIKQIISKEAAKLEDFDITATLLYENGDFIARTNYSISSLRSKRKYKVDNTNNDPYYQRNSIELNRVTGNNVMNSFQLIGSTEVYLSEKTKIGLTGDLIYWDKENKYNLRHFLADIKTEKVQVLAGNIYQSGEFSLQGRGLQANVQIKDSVYLQGGYLDKTYLITDATDRSIGYNTWVGFTSLKHKWRQSQIYYDLNHRYDEKKTLWYNTFSIWNSPTFDLELTQGLSNIDSKEGNQLGALLGVNTYARWSKYQFQSNSFYSSPYYAGIRQGAIQISSSLRRNFDKHSIGLTQSFVRYAPKYSYTDYNNSKQQSNTIGVNYSYRMQSDMFLISPRIVNEQRYNYRTGVMDNLNAIRLSTSFNHNSFTSRLGYNASFDIGNYLSKKDINEKLHYRLNAGINYKQIDLGVSYQFNYSNLSEVINSSYLELLDIGTYTNLMIMGNYRQRFFNNHLGVLLSAYYTKTSTTNDLWQLNSRLEYKLTRDFDIYASSYNNYGGFSKGNQTNYIQLGVIKQLMPYKPYEKAYTLKVAVFHQDEKNISYPASSRIVYINNKSFITNKEGIIEYKKLPIDNYTIQVKNDQQWFANTDKVVLNSDVTHSIYLKQTTTLSGAIRYEYSENSHMINRNLSGQRIVAQSTTGESYTTYTSDTGQYILYLPKGTYTLTLYPENSNYVEVPHNSSVITTDISQPQTKSFVIKIKDKEIQTKKFNAIQF
ncbi:hypothetical protein HX039_01245 [Myroides marinus]|uniref:hypothetical protein n=1 Tax=Myroides marinus TaxID=703342 RepID=UPI002574DC6D|nr:hypothetical protein [Myroides marinus]MDM1402734.1 hypothetical protein [Myroides marinus]